MLPNQVQDQTKRGQITLPLKTHKASNFINVIWKVLRYFKLGLFDSYTLHLHTADSMNTQGDISHVHLSTSALTQGGEGIPKKPEEQLFCPPTALTWGHSCYLGELHKNSQHPATWPLLDFLTLCCVSQTAGRLLFQKAINQPKYPDNTS